MVPLPNTVVLLVAAAAAVAGPRTVTRTVQRAMRVATTSPRCASVVNRRTAAETMATEKGEPLPPACMPEATAAAEAVAVTVMVTRWAAMTSASRSTRPIRSAITSKGSCKAARPSSAALEALRGVGSLLLLLLLCPEGESASASAAGAGVAE